MSEEAEFVRAVRCLQDLMLDGRARAIVILPADVPDEMDWLVLPEIEGQMASARGTTPKRSGSTVGVSSTCGATDISGSFENGEGWTIYTLRATP